MIPIRTRWVGGPPKLIPSPPIEPDTHKDVIIRGLSTIAIRDYLDKYPGCCYTEIANNTNVKIQTIKMQLRHWTISRHVIREKKISVITGRRCYHYRLSTERKLEVIHE